MDNGIKLICALVKCPSNREVWVEIGSHDGMGGNMDMLVNIECYCCSKQIKLDLNDSNNVIETKLMTISDFTIIQFEGFNKYNENGKLGTNS